MNDTQRNQIKRLRAQGQSYGQISKIMGLSENTVKTYCRRHGLGGVVAKKEIIDDNHVCHNCGIPVIQPAGRKEKKFCSDKCRMSWWNSHQDKVNRKAIYEFECAYCKRKFISYANRDRRYCTHECYIKDRFGGGLHG